MRKVGCLAVGIILFLAVGVVATASTIPEAVEDVVIEKGLNTAEITNVESVDYSDLPEQIDIDNIDDTNLEIYEVDIADEKLFVLTFGGEQIAPAPVEQRQFLNFGYSGDMTDGFLESVGGVSMDSNKGYVMMREGSITGISTNLEVIDIAEGGRVEIVIYKNGKAINFGNEVSASSSGAQKDYDVQSTGVVTFEAGDTISVYADGVGETAWKDVITMIEITTN
ncbi:MAG: hypothetical protein ABFQ65_04350 [Nanoarchaeota archaeon]